MTDETHDMGDNESPAPPPEPLPLAHDDAAAVAGAGEFTTGEGLVSFAGIVLLAIWLIFDVFLDDWEVTIVELLLATTVVLIPRLNRATVERVHPVAVIMKVTGYVLAIVGVFYVIEAIESGFYDNASTIIAALINYAAYVMAFLGARQIKL